MTIASNLGKIHQRIQQAEIQYGRVLGSVSLLAASKQQTIADILLAYEMGQHAFGENYLQEALVKINFFKAYQPIEWHFIGSIQSNKVKNIAIHFNWVHSVDHYTIAKQLNEKRPSHFPPLNICIQINIDQAQTKSGVKTYDDLQRLAEKIIAFKNLKLRGLMTIPGFYKSFTQQKEIFDEVAAMQTKLIRQGFFLDTLSMGMSHDFEAAIAAGSNLVRIGEAIFGERKK